MKEEGSKKQNTFSLSVVDKDAYTPTSPDENYSESRDYVNWGRMNNYPQYLYDIYLECSTLQTILNGCTDFTMAGGIVNNVGLGENVYGDTIADVVEKLVLDRFIFGGFALRIKYNMLGEVIEIAHLDYRKCRIDRELSTVYVKNKWAKSNTNCYDEQFNVFNTETGAEDGVQIFYYRGQRTRGIYPIPDYSASLLSCEVQIKCKSFNFNELDNNFASTGIVNFNNGMPAETVKKDTESKLIGKYAGHSNAGRMMISWNEDREHRTDFVRLQTDNLPDRYKNVAEASREDIFISMRAHPQLFGMSIPTGFAAIEYDEAYNILYDTHISKRQQEVMRVFSKIFEKSDAIVFKTQKRTKSNENEQS